MERQPFTSLNLGIVSTDILSEAEIDNHLGSDPTTVERIEPEPAAPKKAAPKTKKAPQTTEEEETEEDQPLVLGPVEADVLGNEEDEDQEDEEELPTPISKKKKVEETPDEVPEEVNAFSSITAELKQLGVFSELENEQEIATGEQFRDRFQTEIQTRSENYISNFFSRFGEDYQDALQAIFIDGVNPREYYQYSNSIENLSELDMSIVDNQKQVIKQYYSALGMAPDKISARIQKLEDAGDLEDDALTYHQALVQKEEVKLEEVRKQKAQEQFQRQQAEQHYNATVSKILNDKIAKKDFDGIPVDHAFASQVGEYITQNKYKAANGELLTDFDLEILNLRKPENYEKKVKLAMLIKLMESDPTFSKLTKKAISKEKNVLFQSLTRQQSTKKKQGEENFTPWNIS